MKTTLTKYQAADMLMADTNAKWSYAGAHALVAHLMEIERETGEEMEFDLVAIRGEWHEYGSAAEACRDMLIDVESEGDSEEEHEERCMEMLIDCYPLIQFVGGIIVGS